MLAHPTVASKRFLITIGDRTVGGMTHRDQMVGPWQVPVADCAVTLADYQGFAGEAMSMGERTPLAALGRTRFGPHGRGRGHYQPAGSSHRVAAREAVRQLDGRLWRTRAKTPRCTPRSRPWAWSCVRHLNVSIPVGKDSLSMRTQWKAGGQGQEGDVARVADRDRVRVRI